MLEIRQLLSVFFLSTSIYLVFDLFAQGFSLTVLAGTIVFYLLAYYTWPKKEKESDSVWLDIAELIVELPFRLIASLLRGLGRLLSNKSGPDFDIDL
ncbi:hypothetical protein M0G74_15180 [Microbulbifer sp. CAU 1566]|uniref:hypothetical protein n=1 Tax=Microbulbifer sp. CAU 1566 TaxID=2933269 RepID=UPI002003D4BE|nr:hypothetical protein [Microbulbifer sp. CAU 1566]MCK7598619.1 hypothetical protein [Microbulbifer sp. CAU 1566]